MENGRERQTELPDALRFQNGERVLTKDEWKLRAEEIRELYQRYMLGRVRDSSDEKLQYAMEGNELAITIEANGRSAAFSVSVSVPDATITKQPEGGWPVIIALGWLTQTEYANANGYAVIIVNPMSVASDNLNREGAFYTLYPYGQKAEEQTGALLAWGWGIGKVMDALSAGAAEEYGINPENNIVCGVSRFGKAVLAAGAFDSRIRVCLPACSGAGGMAAFRYKSEGKTYNLNQAGGPEQYTMTTNEPLSCLQSDAERHWFNDAFCTFENEEDLPFDQHMLASLCADSNRYLFVVAAYMSEDWTNSPSMFLTYRKAEEVYRYLGLEDHIVIHMHREGHAVTDEDMEYLLAFCNQVFYGISPKLDLAVLKTSVYELPENRNAMNYVKEES